MGNIFSASEVIEIGIQIEKNGRDFYTGVGDICKDAKTRGIFEFLKREEATHIKRFEEILSKVKKYEPVEAYPGEYFLYLKALSEGYVFTKQNKGADIAKDVKSDKEAIDLAIGFEKDSILFYNGMKNVVLQEEEKIIDVLIEEEKRHLLKLTELL